MLEGLVAWVLNTYLGKYVNNLNTDQLSVALLKGAVELENLPLKKDALKELELPFEVKAGFIGKITLQIPFYRPHVDPWVISISKLHLIGAPEKQEDFDEEREKLLERERKKALLLSLEEKWKKERQQKGESYWYSVTASVVARIVENIELKIQDVHLRFEDGVTNPSQPFAFGICIKNVSMQNAINEPVEKLMRKKQLDVADFSIYWDTDCTLLGDLPPVDLQEAMDNSMESRDHNYIMEPVCTSALLKRNCSKEPLRSRQTPRLECDIQFETIPLKLSQMQYQQIMGFLKELDRKERQLKFRKWRPKVPVTGNCREWWIFALNANLSEIREQRQRSTWEFALRRAQDAASYTDMYYSKLRGDLLSPAEQAEMHRIEEEQTYEELKVLHEIVFDKFHELAESVKEPLSDSPGVTLTIQHSSSSGMLQYLQSWFPGWGGWYGETQQTYEGEPFERLLPESQEQWNPEDMLGADEFFDPAADASSMNTFTKRDHIFAKLNLQLQGGTVTLLHREKRTLHSNESAFMQLEFSGVKILAESLPRRNSSLLKIQLGGLFLRDLATEGTIFPLLVFPNPQKEVGCFSSVGLQTLSSEMTNQNTAADPDAPVFEMLYERNPAHSNFERRLEVSTRPLNIIYNPQAIKKVADFFYKGRVHTSGFGYQSELEARVAEAARRQYNKLKMQTKAEIRQTIDRLLVGEFIENSKCWSVCLDISAPQVIFPDDFKFVDPVLVVVDLGRILLTNSQDDSKKGGDDFSSEANELSDDEYKTPLATPPSTPPRKESSNSGIKASEYTGVEISEEQFQAHLMSKKMYERYTLSFMDLQIMVGQVKDNWKHVQDSDSVVTLEQHTREVFGTNAHFVKRPYDAENLSFDVPTGSLRDSRAQSPTCGPYEAYPIDMAALTEKCAAASNISSANNSKNEESLIRLEYQFVNNLDIILNPETIVELIGTVRMTNGEKYGRKIATASIGGTKVNVSMCSRLDVNGSLGCLHLMDLTQDTMKNQYVVSIGNTIRYENLISDIGYFESVFLGLDGRSLPDALSFTFTEQSKDECSLNLKMASLHYNHSAKFLKELTLSMDELEENFRSMLKSAATKVTTVLATKTAEYSEMVSLFDTTPRSREHVNLEDNEGDEFGSSSLKTETIKLILNINIESPIVSIPRKPGSPELLVGHLGQISIQNFVPGEDESTSDRLQVEIKDIKLYSLNSSQFMNKKEATCEMTHGLHPSSGPGSIGSQEESHFTRHDFFKSLHKGHAFHILNNTTIQFQLEKIPLERDLNLTFPLSNEDFEISSIMRIEGKFVNPLQVVLAKHVYEQVLQTLDHLIYNEDLNIFPSISASSDCPTSPSSSLHSLGTDFSSERKENGLFSHSGFSPVPNKSMPVRETKSFTQIQANFCISELQVQLSGDLTLGAQGLVSLKFQDFDVEFTKDHPQTLSIQIALRSLLMEDLLEKNPDSMYKNLMVSRGAPKPSSLAHKEYLSQSCPSVSNVEYPDMPRSLPSHMEEAPNVFQSYQRPMCAPRKKQKEDTDSEYPLTPPPSPTSSRSKMPCGKSNFDDSLVHINIFLVDKKHPEFSSRYNKINRSVDVDFNCLDVLITLQTWVVILDFFGIGSTADNHAMKVQPEDVQQTVKSEANILSTTEVQDPVNTKLDLKVHSLSLVLNKTTSELAKANVSKLVTYLELIDGDLSVHGSIGSLSLSDLTSHGEFYRERFTTSGEEALIFQIYKYGRPDPLLQRDCDIRISLRMASVQYVHTQRFQAEVVSFIQHFTQLQDVLGRQRAAIEGQTVRDKAQRASRVVLDIEAGAPVLLIPESSKSNHLIVANLGKLKVKNKFLFAGSPGTFSLKDKDSAQFSSPLGTPKHGMKKVTSTDEPRGLLNLTEGLFMKSSSGTNIMKLKNEPVLNALSKQQGQQPKSPVVPIPDSPEDHVCLLDCIVVDLQDMDIFAAERYPREGSKAVENTGTDLIFPSYFVRQAGGSLLTEPFRLKLKVERNLDKEISHAVPDISIHGNLSSVHCSLDLSKYKLIRGLLENNLGEPTEEFMRPYDLQDPRIHTVLSGEVYTSMTFLIDMVNVSLELMDPKGKDGRSSLARFDFKKSKLLFESFSNQAKSVNLVSHSMMAFDTRYPGQKSTLSVPNVFNCIFQSSRNTANQGAIQIELHFRSTKDSSCFTVVLNNLRVFLIFDWLFLVHDFLHTPSDFKKQDTVTPSQQRSYSSEMTVLPKAVKSGVVTKRSSLQASNEKQLEVRINVTGTEFVVVEDMSCFDTSAIILKGTTVLTYKPKLLDRPFSGSFFGIEVFSCRLGNEQDTALSIIDPVQIQMELIGNSAYPSGSGLLDAFNSEDFPPVLEIQLQALNIRLSYNDVQLFLAIAKSIPQQTSAAVPDSSISDAESAASNLSSSSWANETLSTFESKEASKHTLDPVLEVQLARLQELGFSMDDCRKALLICQGQLKKAASWLFKNAEPLKSISPASRRDSQGAVPVQFVSGVEIKAESICICFIDDCMDCDVPLAELTFSRLNFLQHVRANPEGYAHFTLSGDYYNRELSGWEPFIEPWPCSVSWQQQAASRLHPSRLKLEVKARHRLDINITSVLLEQYTCTKQSWMADYCKQDKEEDTVVSEDWMGSSVDPPCFGQTEMKTPKRRQPFVPFALRNHTGCTLWFATLTTTPTRAALSHSGSPGVVSEENGTLLDDAHNVSEWREVLTGEEIPFEFEARGKLRHRHTHDLRIHQLQVRVSGWEQVNPVSVDKVGIFFRYAAPDKNTSSSTVGSPISRTNIIHPHVYFSSLPPVRVVFEVTMEGSARKVITVRSALIVKNRLETPMELRLDSPSAPDKPVVLPSVMPGDSLAIPLHLTSWRLQARPKGMGVFFCKTPIHWTNVQKAAEVCSSKRECHSMENENSRFFRFCVAIKKENYPDYMPSNIFSDSAKQIFRQPGHIIYLLPTVVICNLLPCELEFYVKGMPINGTLKPGKEAALHTADTSQNIELGVSLENFPICKELLIPPGTQNYMVRMRLYDVNKRLLNLTIRIVCRAEGSLKIFIAAPYWLINKTGLPLIFRQDNAKTDAAGQFEEHELARSLSPLLFCYADKEQPNLCTMRIGKGIHPEGMPGWCQGFSLDGGSGVRALKVIQHGNRPGLIYNIGIDVKKGRGRYIDTCLVTFAPRYLLDNKSTHKLAFAQREFARGQGTSNPDGYISTLPGSSVVFHWPRNDYDQLLCVRLMDVPNCIWSGGFEVNKNNSFHINMRDTLGKCYFLRVEITLRGATYRVSFSDTDQLPPPFRVDNFSKVPVVFIQHSVAEPRLCTEVKSMTSLDYAWDEPTLPPFILLAVKGAGSSEITCSMNDFQDGKQLYYENFIYIAATHTFSGLQEGTGRPVASNKDVAYAELVLDVSPKTQRVILKKKEPGKRSQLWRMTGIGMLCHEGSSVPHNPNKPSPPRSVESCLILDIAGLAAVTDNRYEPLMLRKADRRRSTTQTWSFRDGKLTCGIHGLVVQAKGGMSGLYDGAEVVLGPDTSLEVLGPVPPEQQFINQKMRPGSGVLAVRVIPDGPTRVLQITDFNQRRNDRLSCEGEDSPVTEQDLRKLKNPDTEQELEVLVKLEGGLGLSLVNKIPEELIFASLTGINVHYTHLSSSQVLELSVQDVQVDNQLIGTTQPFMLFLTPIISENKAIETGPAVQLNAMKFPSKNALTDIYKHLMITARRFTVQIEEKLLLKLLSFFGYDQSESEVEKYDENLHEKTLDQGGAQKRYYFENLKISVPQIKLSVFTSNKLPLDLKALKSTLGFPLIRFEDAVINLDPFTRVHPYETKEFIINDILKHFQEELLSQAARILGSVDFLGNPMGLLNDVSEGVTGLIKYGNVGGLIRNVTHGVSNSAAKLHDISEGGEGISANSDKFAGTLSDGLGKTMDNRHQTEREYIRYHAATSGEHLVAGIQGLAHGIIGGLTSVITSTVEGVKTEGGVSGFMSGLGKGLVGTVTKPVAGALDFASETAQAVRDTATLSGPRTQAERVRKPRCCRNPQGLLPRYSESQAEGQEQLFKLTDNIQDEFFIVVENIDSYCVLISSKAVYFLKRGDYVDRDAIFLEVKYDDLYHCLVSKDHGKVYVQLTKKAVSTSSGVAIPGPSHHKPMVHNSWSWTPENITLPAKGNLLYTLAISAAGSRCIVIDQKCHLHLSQQIHPAFVTLLGTYGTRHKDADALRETYWKQCCIQLKMLYYLVFSFSPSVENRTACSLPT
ncbi:vacuolar protein sorting-associated protein 13D isoform C [Alligator mississippiensis]|uniref:Vacuolar protein sorting-associated protein 13D isoform C n=1 Tax=Alligator mississippiensis TaxID=8496 RepID=A0A151PIZ3_ALLMI|nr:vacuolar protein sorting-associated protein 13D isoform C [Alligator mississippiensis]